MLVDPRLSSSVAATGGKFQVAKRLVCVTGYDGHRASPGGLINNLTYN
jgi:hypothetical protein